MKGDRTDSPPLRGSLALFPQRGKAGCRGQLEPPVVTLGQCAAGKKPWWLVANLREHGQGGREVWLSAVGRNKWPLLLPAPQLLLERNSTLNAGNYRSKAEVRKSRRVKEGLLKETGHQALHSYYTFVPRPQCILNKNFPDAS